MASLLNGKYRRFWTFCLVLYIVFSTISLTAHFTSWIHDSKGYENRTSHVKKDQGLYAYNLEGNSNSYFEQLLSQSIVCCRYLKPQHDHIKCL